MVKPARMVPIYLPLALRSPKPSRKVEETGGVLFGEFVVESVFVDGLGEEFGEVAAGVVDDLALLDGLATVEGVSLHQGGAGGVHLDFEGNAELLAVSEQMGVDRGDAGGAGVEIAAVLPIASLHCAVGELDFAAVCGRSSCGRRGGCELRGWCIRSPLCGVRRQRPGRRFRRRG